MTTTQGLVPTLAVLGSADGRKFLARFPGESGIVGGYEIEHTPHELASVIATIRAYHHPARRILSVGSRTMGAERAIIERLGAVSLDWSATGDVTAAHARNLAAIEEDGVAVREAVNGEYDLVLVAGDVPLLPDMLLRHVKLHGLVALLGCGVAMEWPHLRRLFLHLRNTAHRVLMRPGAGFGEVGAAVVAVTYKPVVDEAPAVPAPAAEPGGPRSRGKQPPRSRGKQAPRSRGKKAPRSRGKKAPPPSGGDA